MDNQKIKLQLPLGAVRSVLRNFSINYGKSRMKNDKGWRLDLKTKEFASILINVYDTDTVTIQGGSKPGQLVLIEHLKHALALYQHTRMLRKSEEVF